MVAVHRPKRERLPDERRSRTGDLVISPGAPDEVRLVVTLGYYDDGRLGEIFVRQEKEGGTIGTLLDAVATIASIALQHGVPWSVIANKLAHQRFEPQGMTLDEDDDLKIVSSFLDYLARWTNKRVRLEP